MQSGCLKLLLCGLLGVEAGTRPLAAENIKLIFLNESNDNLNCGLYYNALKIEEQDEKKNIANHLLCWKKMAWKIQRVWLSNVRKKRKLTNYVTKSIMYRHGNHKIRVKYYHNPKRYTNDRPYLQGNKNWHLLTIWTAEVIVKLIMHKLTLHTSASPTYFYQLSKNIITATNATCSHVENFIVSQEYIYLNNSKRMCKLLEKRSWYTSNKI